MFLHHWLDDDIFSSFRFKEWEISLISVIIRCINHRRLWDHQRSVVITEILVLQFDDYEMLINIRFALRINGLLQAKLVAGDFCRKAVCPFLCEPFQLFCPTSVFDPGAIIIWVYIRKKYVYRNDTSLNFVGQSRSKYHHSVLFTTVARSVAISVHLARYHRV